MSKNRILAPFIKGAKLYKKSDIGVLDGVVNAIDSAVQINKELDKEVLSNARGLMLAYLTNDDSHLAGWEDPFLIINFIEDFTNHYQNTVCKPGETIESYHRYELYVRCRRNGAEPLTMWDIPKGTNAPLQRIFQYTKSKGSNYLCFSEEIIRICDFQDVADYEGKIYPTLWNSVNNLCAFINKRVRSPIGSVNSYNDMRSSISRFDSRCMK